MKTQVNAIWYNQTVKHFKNQIKDEIRLVKLQHERFFNYPTDFDIKTGCTKIKVEGFLKEAVSNLGNAEKRLKYFLSRYEPNDSIKPDWKRIEAYIKRNAPKVERCMDTQSKWDFYYVVANFFCSPKWCVPTTERNNERVFNLMNKYCEVY